MARFSHQSALLDKLKHENALLERKKFAVQFERFNPELKSLLEDEIEADLAAVATEIDALQESQSSAKAEDNKVPSARCCQPSCPGARSATSTTRAPALVVAR